MQKIDELFRQRIGLSSDLPLNIKNLSKVLEKMARLIPFENLRVIDEKTTDISKENLIEKILVQKEGGLCYELNPLLYLFLKENGFHVNLVRGAVYSHVNESWSATGKTHVAILLDYDSQHYLVDGGFGGSVPLKPVPLNGEEIASNNGEFKVGEINHKFGDHILMRKLRHKDNEWKKGYIFNSEKKFEDVRELNDMQKIIIDHPQSSFNKSPLMSKLTENGSISLTDTSLTQWKDEKVDKRNINKEEFKELKERYFNF